MEDPCDGHRNVVRSRRSSSGCVLAASIAFTVVCKYCFVSSVAAAWTTVSTATQKQWFGLFHRFASGSFSPAAAVPGQIASSFRAAVLVSAVGGIGAISILHHKNRRRAACFRRHAPCCPKGALGPSSFTSVSVGTMEMLENGCHAYVVGSGTRAIVVASDIFGIHSGRTKDICDQLASEGYLVVMPDFFRGAYPDQGTEPSWWRKLLQAPGLLSPLNTTWTNVEDMLRDDVLPYLERRGCRAGACGILGFCWGAWVVIHACGAFPNVFACGASAHPSVSGMATRWGEDENELLRAVRAPQLVLASRDEPADWKPKGSAEAVLREAVSGSMFQEFGSMSHGFVPRGDMGDSAVALEVRRSLEYIKGFFGKHLAK